MELFTATQALPTDVVILLLLWIGEQFLIAKDGPDELGQFRNQVGLTAMIIMTRFGIASMVLLTIFHACCFLLG